MNDFIITIISILISFILGVFVMAWLMRGLVSPYMKAKRSGVLLRVHNPDGISAKFYAAVMQPSGMLMYKEGKEKRLVSPVEGSVIRCSRAYMMDAPLGETAPFVWKKVVPVGDGEEKKYTLFQGYQDNSIVANALEWALMKPKRKIPGLGLDLTTVLIVIGVLGVIVYFVMSQGGGVI